MASKPRVLGISGSPRQDGNIALLLQRVISGANTQGVQTRIVILSELNIAPCRHCDKCWETGMCVVEDDMQWPSYKLREAGYVILPPLFFYGCNGASKSND